MKLENSITTVVTPDSIATGRGKPYADPLLLACIHIKKSPANTIYVGDMASDYKCALNANIDYAHAGWGYQPITDN